MLRKIHKFINEYNGLELSIIKKLLERKYHGIEKIINRYYISVEKLDGMNSVDYMIQFMNGRSFEDVRSHIKHYNAERPLIGIIKSVSFSDFMTFCKSYQSSFTGNDSPASYTVAGLARCCPLLNPYLVYIYISTVRLKSDVKKVLTLQEIMQHLEGDSLIQLDLNNQFAVKGESYSLGFLAAFM